MNNRLSGKVAVITGGGSWIGKAIARTFAKAGAMVFIIGRNETNLKNTVAEIEHEKGMAHYYVADIIDETAITKAIDETLAHYGKIDILVQNAGVYPSCSLDKMQLSEWKNVIDINLTGSFIILKTIIEPIKKQNNGRIIFISSIAGEEMGYAGYAHYTASKAGMNGLMRTAALELAKYNITVNSIDPGNILNEEVFKVSKAEMDEMLRTIPLGRVGTPTDVANLALFLSSDEASFITGQNIVIDGGETIN